ncbi:MAG TPA: ectonucleotide pyrophosphatase/phosphodiesterase [Phycisphaerae bacterium]|nr:ectonucleotide pyrophosphatase/phosphodiesterase [Phycisphaerae bacterium]
MPYPFFPHPRTALAILLLASLRFAMPVHAADPLPPMDDRIVVLLSIDGLAAYYIDDPKSDIPNLRALIADGARAASMKASTPTVTWVNHATLVTGVNPEKHGVVGNNYYDRATNKRITLISDPVYDKDQIVKVPTVYDLAKAAGLRTAGIRWPATRNAKTLDWCIPDVATDAILHKYTTPELFKEATADHIWADGEAQDRTSDTRIVSDKMCTDVFNMVVHKHRPQLALLHLINVDHIEHLDGPRTPEAYAAVKAADAQVGLVWQELEKDFPGKATLVVVSDHGFSPNEHRINPSDILEKAGLLEVKNLHVVGGKVRAVVQGGSVLLYILDDANHAAIAQQVTDAFTPVDGISKIVPTDHLNDYGVATPQQDPHAPDMILFAKEGYYFGDTSNGAIPEKVKPEHKGSHGHEAEIPDLHAVFMARGVGIKPGARLPEISNLDVAPTVAALLNVPMPNTDGKSLLDTINAP